MFRLSKVNKSAMQTNVYNRGFTIVELLIVIVVIAILAAISVVAFTGVQERAKESVMKADLSNFAKLVEIFRIDHGSYPQPFSPDNDLESLGFKATHSAYPTDPIWNFEYCTDRLDGNTQWILVVMTGTLKGLYVSSNNSTPKEFMASVKRPSPPPCYNGHADSAADDAGLTNIIFNPAPGISGGMSGYGTSGWADWTE